MTLAAGFNCVDGIFVCADTKHVTGVSQFDEEKILDISDGNCQFLLALAGHTDYGKMVVDLVQDNLDACTTGRAMEEVLKQSCLKVFKEQIYSVFKNDRGRPQIEIIAVASFCKSDEEFNSQLLKVVDASMHRIRGFDAVGSGSDIARLYYKWLRPMSLWDLPWKMHIASTVASQILALAHAFDPEVGQGYTSRGIPKISAEPTELLPPTSHFAGPVHKEFSAFLVALRDVIRGCADMKCGPDEMKQILARLNEAVMNGKEADEKLIKEWRDQVKPVPQS